jgi:hypothetical protein
MYMLLVERHNIRDDKLTKSFGLNVPGDPPPSEGSEHFGGVLCPIRWML